MYLTNHLWSGCTWVCSLSCRITKSCTANNLKCWCQPQRCCRPFSWQAHWNEQAGKCRCNWWNDSRFLSNSAWHSETRAALWLCSPCVEKKLVHLQCSYQQCLCCYFLSKWKKGCYASLDCFLQPKAEPLFEYIVEGQYNYKSCYLFFPFS